MHITVSDETTNKKATACVDRETKSAIILHFDDLATLGSVVEILWGLKVPRITVSIPVDVVVGPPGFTKSQGFILYEAHFHGT